MFGRIVPRYDLLNRLMSMGQDRRWRRATASAACPAGGIALDVGTGTGDLALGLRRAGARLAIGVDMTPQMLDVARNRTADGGVCWALGDALRLPFPDETFDCVTNGFVLRNLSDLRAGLAEMARVLRPGGRLVCLDLTQPPEGPLGGLYRVYLDHIMPPLAGFISGDPPAYRYLSRSLRGFPNADDMASLIASVGMDRVRVRRLAFGTMAIHRAVKPATSMAGA